jgi:hypothetical protein
MPNAALLAPGGEFRRHSRVGFARVPVADIGRKEFKDPLAVVAFGANSAGIATPPTGPISGFLITTNFCAAPKPSSCA